jgi:gliding motility-associated peptidyl-prolyl isomerase
MKNNLGILLLFLLVSCAEPVSREPVTRKTSSFLKESIERNKIINKNEESIFKKIMENDSINEYLNSAKGFWYYYIKKDSMDFKLPGTGDKILYNYQISSIDGEILYAEDELGNRSYTVNKQELVTGLQDGLPLMKEGEIVSFLFPSHKVYGYSGYKKIKSNQPLIYTVKVNKIIFNDQKN